MFIDIYSQFLLLGRVSFFQCFNLSQSVALKLNNIVSVWIRMLIFKRYEHNALPRIDRFLDFVSALHIYYKRWTLLRTKKKVSYRLADKHFIYRFLGFGSITSQALSSLSSLWLQLKVCVFKHNLFSGWIKTWQIQRTVWALNTEFARIVKYAHGAFFSPS